MTFKKTKLEKVDFSDKAKNKSEICFNMTEKSSCFQFRKTKLKNGLTILYEKRDVPVTTVMLAVKYGAVYEDKKEKGIAHFIEHLCFKGTEKRTAKQIAFELEKVGGILNAFTGEEETSYHVKLPSEHLELAMDVIFDIFFNPVFLKEDVKKEANVICEEIRMYNDNPHLHVMNKIKNNLYKDPFGMFGAGTEENIRSLTRDRLLEEHRKIHVPENSILCVVGNNDFDDVLKFAEKFSVNRKGEKLERPKIEFQSLKDVEKRTGLQQANIAIGFHFPTAGEKGRYAAEIFSAIFGSGMSSKLFREVREKKGLAYVVKSDLDLGVDYGYMVIYIGTDRGKLDEVIKICLQEFEKMKNLTGEELEEGKEQVLGNKKVESESSDGTAVNLIFEEIFGKAEDYYEYEKNIREISLEDIQKLAEKTEYASFSLTP